MKSNIFIRRFACCILMACFTICTGCDKNKTGSHLSILTQVSTFSSLTHSLLDGEVPYSKIQTFGDFGIGTFHGLDGEMIALDGVFYQVKADGTVINAAPTLKAPFVSVHYFTPHLHENVKSMFVNLDALHTYLTKKLPSLNRIYAFKIKGEFRLLQLRSVPRQQKPYPKFKDIIAKQSIFKFDSIKGTIVGYWMPAFLASINLPGYHFHFISADRKHGGHVLECAVKSAEISIDMIDQIRIVIPKNTDFQKADFKSMQ